ncbi:MAG: LysM peptidoglycan-binding domain-containing protein [Planctomycetes bacterium]|nr:LysM peptidoglycan-binding domain-containing protein [Planctomycetota bacterium]
MRFLILLLALACLFGLAMLWQADRIATAKANQAEARRIAAGDAAHTEVGVVQDGWGVVLIGRPAGDAGLTPADGSNAPAGGPSGRNDGGGEAQVPVAPPIANEPADIEYVVGPGMSLSKIAAAQYGTSNKALVDALARYNGLASADALQAGVTLKLPAPPKLQAFANSH